MRSPTNLSKQACLKSRKGAWSSHCAQSLLYDHLPVISNKTVSFVDKKTVPIDSVRLIMQAINPTILIDMPQSSASEMLCRGQGLDETKKKMVMLDDMVNESWSVSKGE